jgi:steroid delta-isomerase-like uncharacterized protein
VSGNEAVARLFIEACVNGAAMHRLAEFVAPEVVIHAGTTGGAPDTRGLPELADVLCLMQAVFPDFHVTVEDVFGTGDRVAMRWTARGTHEAEWAGVAPTGRRVVFGGIDIYRVDGGRIHEWWRNDDFAYLLQQLGGSCTLNG